MTLAVDGPAQRLPKPRLQWGAAFKALRRLLADKEDTVQVFEIMRALNGGSSAWGYQKLLETPQGGRLAYERVELEPLLMDDAWLNQFPEGSVGAAYRHFVRSENLSAQGLADISRTGAKPVEQRHPYAWFGRRTRDVHDIWHVLSGYHRDGLGEA
ncbi:Coq4 family protein, partial [Phenylobacterium sp.]|uniref:Coq4 family protein n=1 Tax=Phenylobacterium sp. TaxID=1871053 RepID=UPI0035C79D9C